MHKVQVAWLDLMKDLQVHPQRSFPVWDLLVAMYGESHRKYHTLSHIVAGVQEFQSIRYLLSDAPNTLYAWFMHDSFHDPAHYKDNEVRSGHIALGLSQALGLEEEFGLDVVKKVLATAGHTESDVPEDMDTAFLLDVDMSILGQPFPRFLQYCLDISAEYSFLGPEKFKKGRRSFVRKVLARDRLYYTDVFFEQYEEQARKNLELLKDGL